jgi:hypothetical protein
MTPFVYCDIERANPVVNFKQKVAIKLATLINSYPIFLEMAFIMNVYRLSVLYDRRDDGNFRGGCRLNSPTGFDKFDVVS